MIVACFAGCSDNTTKPGGVVDVSGDNSDNKEIILSDNKIEEVEGEVETVAETSLGLDVETYISGTYYLEGVFYGEGEAIPVQMATDGKSCHFTATYSGIALGLLVIDNATYVVLPKTKQYTEISETLLNLLDLDNGLGVDDFQKIAAEGFSNTGSKMSQYAVTINGESGLCTVFTFEKSEFKLYSIGDKLIQLENYDADGTMIMQIAVNSISSQIPADQLTLNGLEKASVTSFIQSFVASAVV